MTDIYTTTNSIKTTDKKQCFTILPKKGKTKEGQWLIQNKRKKLALTWVQILMQNSTNTEGAHGLKMQTAKCTKSLTKAIVYKDSNFL